MEDRLLQTNDAALKKLNEAWSAGKLTVVVGAGVSVGSRLPLWDELLTEMLGGYVDSEYSEEPYSFFRREIIQRLRDEFAAQSPLTFAQHLQSQMSHDAFVDLLHSALYKSFKSAPEPSELAHEIAALGPRLHSVLSFNFDGLIEAALARVPVEHTTVWKPSQLSEIRGLPVYHPHGFLPFQRESDQQYEIVFAEADYHTQYSSQLSWNNVVILRALLETTCLFVGTSLTDPNQRRLLDYACRQNSTPRHYFLWRIPDVHHASGSDKLLQSVHQKIFQGAYSRLGLNPVYTYEWADAPRIVQRIRRSE